MIEEIGRHVLVKVATVNFLDGVWFVVIVKRRGDHFALDVGVRVAIVVENGFIVIVGERMVESIHVALSVENETAVELFLELRPGWEKRVQTVAVVSGEELFRRWVEE